MSTYILQLGQKKRKPKAKKNWLKLTGFLRDHTSSLAFGVKTPVGIRPCNHNDEIVNFLCGRQFSLNRMNNDKYQAHFDNKATYYFAGQSDTRKPFTLIMVDVDCHKAGTLDGAKKFAQHLNTKFFSGQMYTEVSTNGNGVHGYVRLQKDDWGAPEINMGLKRLERNLKAEIKGFDIEDVEIKGTLPEITWSQTAKGKVDGLKTGMLAKLPRNATLDDLKNTTLIDMGFLLKLPLMDEKTAPKIRVAGSSRGGSVSGRLFNDMELGKLETTYKAFAEALLEGDGLRIGNRAKVVVEDVAVFAMLLRHFTLNPNANGAMPTKWFKTLWESLFECGDVSRQFDPKRFKAMKDLLCSFGMIHVIDRNYRVGTLGDDGEYVKGEAAKWSGSELFLQMTEHKVDVEVGIDKEGEGRNILYRNKAFSLFQDPSRRSLNLVKTYQLTPRYRLFDPSDPQLAVPWSLAA